MSKSEDWIMCGFTMNPIPASKCERGIQDISWRVLTRQEQLCCLSCFAKPPLTISEAPLTISEPYAPNSGISVALMKWKFFMTRVQSLQREYHNPGEIRGCSPSTQKHW